MIPSLSVIKGAAIGRKPENGPQYGDALEDGTCYTLNCTEIHAVAGTLDASHGRLQGCSGQDANHGHSHLVPAAFQPRIARNGRGNTGDVVNALQSQSGQTGKGDAAPCVAVFQQSSMEGRGTIGYDDSGVAKPAKTQQDGQMIQNGTEVRRLTPEECEALQAFPKGWTKIPWRGKPAAQCPDGPRYAALGNSMATNCMRWIGQRLEQVL